jgi:hypothetical protein
MLPLVVAAFAGATLAVACERPESRAVVPAPEPRESVAMQQQPAAPTRPTAAPAQGTPAVPRDTLEDTMITGRIKAAILTDPAMAGSDISVNTDHGVVSLMGTVKSYEQTGIASGYAQRQDGVMRVDSQLSLSPQ